MKFTDGYWLHRKGFSALHPRDVSDVVTDARTLTVYAPTKRINSRGDALNLPQLTVTFDAPLPDVIGVTIEHFQGAVDNGPHFEINRSGPAPTFSRDAGTASITSGNLTARVSTTGDWGVDFLGNGGLLTSSTPRSVGVITDDGGRSFVHEQLSLGVGTNVYGLGERFGAFVKNGQSIDIWNEDGGTSSDLAYKNIPFFMTNDGYGVFVNHPEKVSFEVGSEVVSRTQFSVEGQKLQYFIIHGPTPKEIMRRYTELTGRPARIPAWSYGLWLSTSFTTDYDEATVNSFIDGMDQRNLPLSVFHFDCHWMRSFHWSDFIWDPATFPDPEGMLARLHDRGLKVCVWINPYIAQRSYLFREGLERGYLVKRPDGSVWQWDMWQAGMGLVDFTNPDAVLWYQDKLRALLGQGVDSFKTDFGERIPTDVAWHDGSDPQKMHNYYAQLYNRTVFDLLSKELGAGEAVVFARSATAAGQTMPVHWGGDCESTFAAMAESLRGGLSLAASGFSFWSHDIGGFEGTPEPEIFKRWIAFGLLSSHSRLHGSNSYRVPWLVDEESVDVLRQFTEQKMRLMPYLAKSAEESYTEGIPLMRPLFMEFPEDPGCAHLDRQYMLGPDLLVAPVMDPSGTVSFYLPEGTWTHLRSGEQLAGPRWHRKAYSVMEAATWVREGAVLPLGTVTDRPDYDWAGNVEFKAFAAPDGARRITVPSPDGSWTEFEVTVRDGAVRAASARQ
ncbi:alpha-xylosidase [Pseudarthrobacter defluvii]|uniref:alpha-xylosidase n=1 Tax=Pseudarthrobacter defluvii TaxID=410837 RepID=UPI0025770D32|nr:alpha-xylosidase [Pseudarthrobacter defluvii]WJH24185.1 alpha-xylosidase [Pseudarthrobacter defluvii]